MKQAVDSHLEPSPTAADNSQQVCARKKASTCAGLSCARSGRHFLFVFFGLASFSALVPSVALVHLQPVMRSHRHRSRRRSLSSLHPVHTHSLSLSYTRTLTHPRSGAVTSLIPHGGLGAGSQSAGSLLGRTLPAMCFIMVSQTKATYDPEPLKLIFSTFFFLKKSFSNYNATLSHQRNLPSNVTRGRVVNGKRITSRHRRNSR